MSLPLRKNRAWQANPILELFVKEWRFWKEERTRPHYSLAYAPQIESNFPIYPIDMPSLLALPYGNLDESGVPFNREMKPYPAVYHPTTIAEYALARWNAYLTSQDERDLDAFMIQARWLIEHELRPTEDMGVWPIPFASHEYNVSPMWLSALTQSNVISVLVRAYHITKEEHYLQVAQRAVRSFDKDIQAGGVAVTVNEDGLFFEEVASGKASHILNGYIIALLGLYDYVACTGDKHVEGLINRSLKTFHTLIDEYDMGYWSRYDLRFRSPATRFYHALHVTLLEALAQLSGCQHCKALAMKWDIYQHSRIAQIRYLIVSRKLRYKRGLMKLRPKHSALNI